MKKPAKKTDPKWMLYLEENIIVNKPEPEFDFKKYAYALEEFQEMIYNFENTEIETRLGWMEKDFIAEAECEDWNKPTQAGKKHYKDFLENKKELKEMKKYYEEGIKYLKDRFQNKVGHIPNPRKKIYDAVLKLDGDWFLYFAQKLY